jgi:hypothetical protein
MISVTDMGAGMDPQTVAQAFEPFSPRSRSASVLVSASAKYMAQLATSALFRARAGTTVQLYLPRLADEVAPYRNSTSHLRRNGGRKKRCSSSRTTTSGPIPSTVDFIVKQFSFSDLAAKVRDVLDKIED